MKRLVNMIKNMPISKMTEPRIISVGNNHLGFIIEKTTDGKTKVVIKNWLGNKPSWDEQAMVEETLRFELNEKGEMTEGLLSWNNYYSSSYKTSYN